MAINFEAANMAGYNNPKIEVFRVSMDNTTHIISDAPNKQEIKRCLGRGSIPALVAITPNGSDIIMLWISAYNAGSDGETIAFGEGSFQIMYLPNSEQPVFNG